MRQESLRDLTNGLKVVVRRGTAKLSQKREATDAVPRKKQRTILAYSPSRPGLEQE